MNQFGGAAMGMTGKQFQGFVRLSVAQLEKALEVTPDNEELKKLLEIYRDMLEDGN